MQQTNKFKNYNKKKENQEPKRVLTKEEKFELMIEKWKRDSRERINDLLKRNNNKIDNESYKVSTNQNS